MKLSKLKLEQIILEELSALLEASGDETIKRALRALYKSQKDNPETRRQIKDLADALKLAGFKDPELMGQRPVPVERPRGPSLGPSPELEENDTVLEDSNNDSLSSDLINVGADTNTKLQDVIDKLEDLDISLDYIASALTGVDPSEISRLQRGHGRAAAASSISAAAAPPTAPPKKDEI